MLKTNPIRRSFEGEWAWVAGTDRVIVRRHWVADCPECGEKVTWSGAGWTSRTRKNTKDALYRHVQEHHKPGSVGRD